MQRKRTASPPLSPADQDANNAIWQVWQRALDLPRGAERERLLLVVPFFLGGGTWGIERLREEGCWPVWASQGVPHGC